jgi:hypothetical protein
MATDVHLDNPSIRFQKEGMFIRSAPNADLINEVD